MQNLQKNIRTGSAFLCHNNKILAYGKHQITDFDFLKGVCTRIDIFDFPSYPLVQGLFQWFSVKESPTMQEMQDIWVLSMGEEDPLEKEIVTHSGTLARKISWMEEPGGLQSKAKCCIESDTTDAIQHVCMRCCSKHVQETQGTMVKEIWEKLTCVPTVVSVDLNPDPGTHFSHREY